MSIVECNKLNQNESLILKYASLTTDYGIVKKQVYFGIKFEIQMIHVHKLIVIINYAATLYL